MSAYNAAKGDGELHRPLALDLTQYSIRSTPCAPSLTESG